MGRQPWKRPERTIASAQPARTKGSHLPPRYFVHETFTPQPEGRVRQLIEETPDDGVSWAASFDGLYSPAPAGASP